MRSKDWAWGSTASASDRSAQVRRYQQHLHKRNWVSDLLARQSLSKVGHTHPSSSSSSPLLALHTKSFLPDDSEKYAREKFGTQKSISSDEFFGRESYDPAAQQEAKTRLTGFEGATSISSNAYFGRPEDDIAEGSGDYGDLETAAKDLIRRFGLTAGDDLENLTNVLGEGSRRLQGAIRNYLSN